MRGNLLNRAKRADGANTDASEGALEYRHKVEQDLTSKLDATLEPLVGAGRFRASVSAECDLTSGEQNEETFDPARSAMVTSQKTEDTSTTTRAATGIPGTASNLPDSAPRPVAGGGTSRKTENIAYQTSRTVTRTVLPQGTIKRLSISVLIDHEAHWEGSGANAKRVLVPPTPERVKVIHDLVAAAAGFNADRGDQLIVESLPFESTLNLDPPASLQPVAHTDPKPRTPLEQLKSDPKLMAGLAAIVAVVLAVFVFIIMRMRKRSTGLAVQAQTTPMLAAASAPDRSLASASESARSQDAWAPSSSAAMGAAATGLPTLAAPRFEALTLQLRETAHKDAEICAGVLRGWLKEGRA
jgi:flagellar M-ring protein FliF